MPGKKPAPGVPPGKERKGAALMNQMGLGVTDMSQMENMMYGDLENDADLEAELLALTGGSGGSGHASPKKSRPMPTAGPTDIASINALAAKTIEDIDDDVDVSDTEDPDLLAELQELSPEEQSPEPSTQAPITNPVPQNQHRSEPPKPAPRNPVPQNLSPMHGTSTQPPKSSSTSSLSAQSQMGESNVPRSSTSPSVAQMPSGGGGMVSLLQERLQMYSQASEVAKTAGDSSKARRLGRGLKTLQDLLRKAKAGRAVNEDEIPPPVAMGVSTAVKSIQPDDSRSTSSSTASSPVKPSTNSSVKEKLMHRRDLYKVVALEAKKHNDIETAKKYVVVAKQFDSVLEALDAGNEVDLSNMPPEPPPYKGPSNMHPAPRVEMARRQGAGNAEKEVDDAPMPTPEQEREIFKAPPPPSSPLEALQQRLDKFKSCEDTAKSAGESSKARRMGRIVKQYQDAIKAHRAGKPVDFEDLPAPPGFGSIPVGPPQSSPAHRDPHATSPPQPHPRPTAGAAAASSSDSNLKPQPARRTPSPGRGQATPPRHQMSDAEISKAASLKRSPSSRQEQTVQFLQERMNEYKVAALEAKKKNDLELAKKYLRFAKGFGPMITAAQGGLPVNLSQVPPSPSDDSESAFVVVSAEDCVPQGDRTEVYKKLEQDLISQIRMSSTNVQHFTKLGDVASSARFQKIEQNCRKDLDSLKNAFRHGDPVPKFHYENRTYSIVRCNPDLGEDHLELTIVRGIQYHLPSGYEEKDLSTYVKHEFPFPSTDEPQCGQTETVKYSIHPEYNEPFKISINRKARAFLRTVERKAVKLEVFYKRGFLKSDKLLGTASVKLQSLETHCEIHDSFDLMDGKKTAGGKLEVKIRIKDPLKTKQVDEVKEKWLVIDQFLRTAVSSKAQAPPPKPVKRTISSDGSTCMEVLRYEKQQLDKQILYLKDSLNPSQLQALQNKSKLLEDKVEQTQQRLKAGGIEAWKEYAKEIELSIPTYDHEARQLAQHGDMQKAQNMLMKKKSAEKELAAIKSKIRS